MGDFADSALGGGARKLVSKWRALANVFRDHSEVSLALAYERCADELEVVLHLQREELLTLDEASRFGGYSTDHLGRMIRAGRIPNAGRPGAPRIRREHVPIKAGRMVATPGSESEVERTQIVRSIVNHGG